MFHLRFTSMSTPYQILPTLEIPPSEISFSFARSGGKGGQNVNKVETKVELAFDVLNSPCLTIAQRQLLLQKLASRLDSNGILRITSQNHRSQIQNRNDTIEKFTALLTKALTPEKKRTKTKPTKSSKEKRLNAKKQQSEKKSARRVKLIS
jgi:ribosome-associated protein